MFVEIACVILLFLGYNYFLRHKNNSTAISGFPPGPKGFPIFGNVHQLGFYPFKTFLSLKATYGNIIGIKLPGGRLAVVLNDPKVIRDALNMVELSGRIDEANGEQFHEGKTTLHEQRKFIMKTLSSGKKSSTTFESIIHQGIIELFASLVDLNEKPFQPETVFNTAIVNTLWTIVTGRNMLKEKTFSNAYLFYPKIYNLGPEEFASHSSLMDTSNELLALVREEYKEQNSATDVEPSENGDVGINSTEPSSALLLVMWDLFSAGCETITSTLASSFLYLSTNSNVQQKMVKEIKEIMGNGRLPSLADRPNLPYVEATIMEVLRMCSLAPVAITHRAIETVKFYGYTIPKDTVILPNLYGIHHNKDIWGDPEVFRPERFINQQDGKLIRTNQAFLPFGVGKRACLGESLAKDVLFMFLTSIVQKYEIQLNPAKPKPNPIDFNSLFLLVSKPYEYILAERERTY